MLTSPLFLVSIASGIGIEWKAAHAGALMGIAPAGGMLAGVKRCLRRRLLRVSRLLWIGRLLRVCGRLRRGCIALLRLLLRLLIRCDAKTFDCGKDASVVIAAVDTGIYIDTLPRLEVVELLHLVSCKLYEHKVGV